MRKLILGLAVSLDSYIEDQNGAYDWCFTDQDYGLSEFMRQVDAAFIGRKTYEMMQHVDDPGYGFETLKKYIFSTSLEKVQDNETLIRTNAEEEVRTIKNSTGKDIWLFGGGELITALMNMGQVDELWLSVHPVILGGGKPLFRNIRNRNYLKLLETKVYDTGLVSLKYSITH